MLKREDIINFVVEHQTALIKERYGAYEEAKEIIEFITSQIYTHPRDKIKYATRDATLKFLAKALPSKALLATLPKDIRIGVYNIIKLQRITEELEIKLINKLCEIVEKEKINSINELNATIYKKAFVAATTYKEREEQLEYVLKVATFIKEFIQKYSLFLDVGIKFLSLYGVAKVLTDGYQLFKNYIDKIDEFKEIIKNEELKYLEKIYRKGDLK